MPLRSRPKTSPPPVDDHACLHQETDLQSRRNLSNSARAFHAADRASILPHDPDREIVAVDVERDVQILRMQPGPAGIAKPPGLATGQDQLPDGGAIARP